MLEKKKIVLGITGGIAAYKAAELTREFVKRGASVHVIMTRNATAFLTPLTLQTLSGNAVYTDTFTLTGEWEIGHVSLADSADAVVVAPATANFIGKVAAGIADDLLTTMIMATQAPVLICPAMNVHMYANAIVQENIAKLRAKGYAFVDPGCGELACKTEGVGRLAELGDIAEEVESALTAKDLAGERILVTAGPTREPLDPVRFITNYSSGKMGYAAAMMARRRGAEVTLISGPTSLPAPRGVRYIGVDSAIEMRDAVMREIKKSTVIIKAAAVADYRPQSFSGSKIKKKTGPLVLNLSRNPDIIAEVGRKKGKRILVGFAVETDHLVEYARQKMTQKNMDLIVANDITQTGAGFQTETNIVKILDRQGGTEDLPMMDKKKVADRILDRVKALREKRG
ncbi:MAG TPA: bifunctional phosphopantothenoylcysteine decarboxylase/phosphopantothenate--cysteine ligase CoaBC [Syntrophales bacterium]|nr:bifunctional phosphopantothenoylcysteine decarboxylase/phosphopantothenate--cysteine ligase CoaBC [Syntrophales bacterium]HOX95116.1 bifunctional phosphopantothenoylcysteine decarboxylase/phosphopantothenate--cysteine ligase CoaBC [Syntrophales bacterium]HPI55848.1 bifunctional phosphopantothenoylcysteine decarboxylase/phosphopantothenate--cysteine ligase CoaBC [Syntrophales bacterium]HPN23661.1 bifunctional phosphopantothenoylcysteine decarboxylase/phosphopantothenate--cysteine ligase CoaBC 